jgi:hypothetical protein
MVKMTVTGGEKPQRRSRGAIAPVTLAEIAELQEGQNLDFKREINLDKPELKARLVDDVVAFLNRGASRILVGVVEKEGRFDAFRPIAGDADKVALRIQTCIQDSITPVPLDVQVVAISQGDGFVIDIQIPAHQGGPFMNRLNGGYLIRSGSRNLPIDPGMFRSRFIDERSWLARLEELTATEDEAVARSGRVAPGQALRIAILPREHFDHLRAPFAQGDHVRSSAPNFHHQVQWLKVCEDGHEALSIDLKPQGIERLFIRDDWFIHAHIAYAIQQMPGEERLGLYKFKQGFERYLKDIAAFLAEQEIEGPFAVTLSLQGLGETEHFHAWFPRTSVIRTLRPKLVDSVDDPDLIADFERRVQQATVWG